MLKTKTMLIALAISGMTLPSLALADNTDAVIKYRKAVYTSMKGHMGAMAGIMRDGLTDYSGHILNHALAIQNAAKILPSLFPEGSDLGDTGALSNIWTDKAGFDKAAKRLEDASAALVQAAQSGDIKLIGSSIGKVGGSCKGCHDNYRASN